MIRLSPLFLLSMIWLLFLLTGCDSGSVQISTCLSDKDCSFGQTCEKGQCVGDAADDDDDVFNPGDGDNDATEDDDDDTEDGDSSSDDDDDDDDNLDGDDSDGDTSDGDDDPGLACEQSGGQCVLDLPCASGSHLSVDTLGCDTTANPYCCLPNIPACVQNGGQCIELGNPCPNSWVSLDSNAGCDGICCMPDPTRSCAENGGACVPPTPQSTCPAGTVSVQSECEGQTICCAELETACSNQGGYCQATNFPPNCDQNDYEPSPNALGCANGQMCCLPEDTRCYTDDDCGDPTCRDLQANSCAQSNPICDRDTGYCGVDEDFYQSARCYDDGMCHQSQLCNEDDETWVEWGVAMAKTYRNAGVRKTANWNATPTPAATRKRTASATWAAFAPVRGLAQAARTVTAATKPPPAIVMERNAASCHNPRNRTPVSKAADTAFSLGAGLAGRASMMRTPTAARKWAGDNTTSAVYPTETLSLCFLTRGPTPSRHTSS